MQTCRKYIKHHEFWAIPEEEKVLRKALRTRWSVRNFPWVVITDDTGRVLNPKANKQIEAGSAGFPFQQAPVVSIEDLAPLQLNTQLCFVAFMEGKSNPDVLAEMKALKMTYRNVTFAFASQPSKIAKKIRGFAGIKSASAFLIMDVRNKVKFYRSEVAVGGAADFLRDFTSGALTANVGTGQIPSQDDPNDGKTYDYDLFVIGGGSGGLACSKAAASEGARVAVADFVRPSPPGTTWGLGGTCVNVGCIPKKLCHTAALLGEAVHDAQKYGWRVTTESKGGPSHDWATLIGNVQKHIRGLNEGYEAQLKSKDVTYYNAFATFRDAHTVELKYGWGKDAKVETKTARRFVVACGGRPRYPDGEGLKEYSISSDDIFSLQKPPGKTLVIGASYVALECAGFLTGLGYDTTVMVRSILLRGFDQQMANKIGDYMEKTGTKFLREYTPLRCERLENGRLRVFYKSRKGGSKEESMEVDTLLMAIGRIPETRWLGLDKLGMKLAKNGKILTAKNEQTSVPNIYAIGDVAQDKLELTPVAIQAGRLLAARLFGGGREIMNYNKVATAVFTPLEYGAIGYSEEDAKEVIGEDNIEVYHATYRPLEMFVAERMEDDCYVKLVVDKNRNELVVGFHILGPHAGEVTQGFGIAIRKNATKADFDLTVGIHPTVAEEFTTLEITKSSGKSAKTEGC